MQLNFKELALILYVYSVFIGVRVAIETQKRVYGLKKSDNPEVTPCHNV